MILQLCVYAFIQEFKRTKTKQNHFFSEDLSQTLLTCIAAGYSVCDRLSNECPFILIMNIYTVVLSKPLTQQSCAVNLKHFASVNKGWFREIKEDNQMLEIKTVSLTLFEICLRLLLLSFIRFFFSEYLQAGWKSSEDWLHYWEFTASVKSRRRVM